MNSDERNTASVIVFLTIIAIILGGGFYLITHKDIYLTPKEETKQEETKSIKIDEEKDYIYYTDEEVLDEENELIYKTINLNINTTEAKALQDELNNNMTAIKETLVKDENENIVSTEMISYDYVITSKYISLSVITYTYLSNEEQVTKSTVKHYVFDVTTGKILTNREILKKENKTDQEVRVKIREYVSNDADVDIDATLNSEYSLSINKQEKLVINTVVKTSNMDYNVNIEMD